MGNLDSQVMNSHHPCRKTAWLCLELTVLALTVWACYHAWRKPKLALWEERKVELVEFARKAEPLIAALEAYRKEHKRYPDQLEQLVPRYLPRIPEPTKVARSGWHYEQRTWEVDLMSPPNYKPPPNYMPVSEYKLWVSVRRDFCPKDFGFGDVFAYHTLSDYPRKAYGGVLERIGEWGYYHE